MNWAKAWTGLRCALVLVGTPAAVAAQERSFHGLYVAAEVAREDFIGGSFVNNTDFLAQATRGVASLVAGARFQTPLGVVFGAEGTWGRTDGHLTFDDAAQDLSIDYSNNSQTSLGGMVGFALQRATPVLFFVHASEVTRTFDVVVTDNGTTFIQRDEQGQLRYGVGVEVDPVDYVNVRFRVGSGRADFGDAVTNITPSKRLQYGLAVVVQF